MALTQTGSSHIGLYGTLDEIEELRRTGRQKHANLIYVLDGQTYEGEILDQISMETVLSDEHRKSLVDNLETYEFIALQKEYSNYLEKRNRIVIPDEDGSFREFVIAEAAKYLDSEGRKVQVFAHASYLELRKAAVIPPQSFKGILSQHIGRALNGTGWEVGLIELKGDKTLSHESHSSPYERLISISREYGGELRFRVEHDGNKVTGRYVDLLEHIGENNGREAEFGKDLESIRRVESQDIVTALLGLGPETEDGTRVEVLVEDDDALQRWGRYDKDGNLHHLIEPYEIESEREEMTEEEARRYTRTALDKRINTQITYEADILDLEEVPGLSHEKLRFGDSVRVKDTGFVPPLYVDARVFELVRSLKHKSSKKVKLGDFIEYTEDEVFALWRSFQKDIIARLAKYVLVTIVSDGGSTFKNGEGSTTLTADTFLYGDETDVDGSTYDYQWIKFDKDGEHVDGFIETGKTLSVNASDVDEKATYRVIVSYGPEVVNKDDYTLTVVSDGEKGEKGDEGPRGLQGIQGEDGQQGIPGEDGEDGKTSYTHIAYADSDDGGGFSQNPEGKAYVGMYADFNESDSNDPDDYKWSLIKGADGTEGIPGPKGDDGQTPYFHTAWANNEDGTDGFSTTDGLGKTYIGTYTDFNQNSSEDPSKYTWVKIKGDKGDKGEKGDNGPRGLQGIQGETGEQGIPGEKGEDGKTSYTHIAYADTSTGGGFNQNPDGKDYIGMYVDFIEADSNDPDDYKWSLIKGADGSQGVAGPKGDDGKTPYFHTAWANNNTGTSGFSTTVSDGKSYIGTYTDFVQKDSTDPTKYKWAKIKGDKGDKGDTGSKGDQGPPGVQGLQGEKGEKGIPGEDGEDGKTSYTHIAYADTSSGGGFSQNPDGKKYVGIYVDFEELDSTNPDKYKWSLIKGADGSQGIAGPKGDDGKTPYFHTAWSNNDNGTSGFSTTDSLGKTHIGTYTDFTQNDSTDPSKYNWTKIKGDKGDKGDEGPRGAQGLQGAKGEQGIAGEKGEDGKTSYTHIAYADNSSGGGFSQNPSGKTYIGMYVDFTEGDSSDPTKYKWSLIKGADGSQGIAGPKGDDGKTPYFHTAWANNNTGTSGFSTTVSDGKSYIGTYTDFTQNDSTDPSKYKWAKIKGDKGDKGDTGAKGSKGDKGDTGAKGNDGKDGKNGSDGADGRSIVSVTPQYYKSTSETTQSGGSWSANKPAWEPNRYLWRRDEIVFANPAGTSHSNPVIDDSWKAITTADGKNSVFYQTTQPSTSNRKVGDTWFKTNADNKMYQFNGSSWVEAKFGEQAIVANSITANHIKSLAGLNVGDGQFRVDANGNVTFKGTLDGADGNFEGDVTFRDKQGNETLNLNGDKVSSFIIRDETYLTTYDWSIEDGKIFSEKRVLNSPLGQGWRLERNYTINYDYISFIDAKAGNSVEYSASGISALNNDPYVIGSLASDIALVPGAMNGGGVVVIDGNVLSTGNVATGPNKEVVISPKNNHGYIEFFENDGDKRFGWIGKGSESSKYFTINADGVAVIIGADSAGGRIASSYVYDRTYSGAANMRITAEGTFGRSTSSEKYKINISPQFTNKESRLEYSYKLLDIPIVGWFDKSESEICAEEINTGEVISEDSFKLKRHIGLTSEMVYAAGFKEHVEINSEGDLEGIEYDRLWIHLIPLTKHLFKGMKILFKRLFKLRKEVRSLRSELDEQKELTQDLLERIEKLEEK